jgi:hypothetical protein
MLAADTTVTVSLRTDSNRRPAAYHAAALTSGATKAHIQRVRASCRARTGNLLGTGEMRWSSCAKEADHAATRHGSLRAPRALGGIRTRNIQHLGLVSLPVGVRARASLWTASNRLLRLTGATLCLVSYRGRAAGQRLELQFTASEAVVLPLDDPASGVCAARDSNPLFPGVRVRCIARHARGA